jgi:hypothetical protein
VLPSPVGYGDMAPTTHLGRVCAAAVAAVGILLGSVLTASLSCLLEWNTEEYTTLRILEREKARKMLKTMAHDRLALHLRFFADRRRRRANLQQRDAKIHFAFFHLREFRPTEKNELTVKLRKLQRLQHENVSVMASDSIKIDRLLGRLKHAQDACAYALKQVQSADVMEGVARRLQPHLALASTAGCLSEDDSEIKLPASLAKNPILAQAMHRRNLSLKISEHAQQNRGENVGAARYSVDGAVEADANESKKLPAGLKRRETVRNFTKRVANLNKQTANSRWWRDKDQLKKVHEGYRRHAAVLGSVGTVSALLQNEAVIAGTATQVELNWLKFVNSCSTLLCLVCLLRIYWSVTSWQHITDLIASTAYRRCLF